MVGGGGWLQSRCGNLVSVSMVCRGRDAAAYLCKGEPGLGLRVLLLCGRCRGHLRGRIWIQAGVASWLKNDWLACFAGSERGGYGYGYRKRQVGVGGAAGGGGPKGRNWWAEDREGSSGNGMLKESRGGQGQKAGHVGVPTFETVCCRVVCVRCRGQGDGRSE